jgi:hypothetical protein
VFQPVLAKTFIPVTNLKRMLLVSEALWYGQKELFFHFLNVQKKAKNHLILDLLSFGK